MTERSNARIRILILLLVAFCVQATVASDLRVAGVAPDLMLLFAICAGISGGSRQGVLLGFAAGLLSDLYLTDTPVGLAALVCCVIGYVVGSLRENVLPDGWLLTPVLALVATGAGVVLFVGVGDIVGQTQLVAVGRTALIRIALGEGMWAAVLAVPATWLLARAGRGSAGALGLDRGRPDRVGLR